MEIFPQKYCLSGVDRYVLWFQNDVDGVLTTSDDRIATFSTLEAAREFANQRGLILSLAERDTVLQLDWIADRRGFAAGDIDCTETLTAWNFFVDIAATLPERSAEFRSFDRKLNAIYGKVFWGNNLPAVTPEGEHYEAAWSSEEIDEIKSILTTGLALFTSNVDHET